MQPSNGSRVLNKTKRDRVVEVLEIILGGCVWVAFILMYFTEKHPAIRFYVTWTFRAYAAAMLAFFLGIILCGVFLAARESLSMYQSIVNAGN